MLRIVPAYVAYLLVLRCMDFTGSNHITSLGWVAALTYTVNFIHRPPWPIGHIWSLSIEEHFYLMWPVVVAAGGIRWARFTALFWIGVCFVLRWVILLSFPRWTQMAELWTFTRLDTIAFGCLLATLCWDAAWRQRLDQLCRRNRLLVAMAIAIAMSVLVLSRSGKYQVGIGYSFNTAMIALLMYAAVRRPASIFGKMLNGRILATIGVGSYSLYLWQQLFLNPNSAAWPCRFPENLFLAATAAACSYFLVEQPFLRLKGKLKNASV